MGSEVAKKSSASRKKKSRKTSSVKRNTYQKLIQPSPGFYHNLLRLFIVVVAVCAVVLSYLYFWLYRYEKQSINGALTQYVEDVADRNWDKIYRDDTRYFTELNTKESVASYLLYLYADSKPSGTTFSLISSDDQYQYYDAYYQQEKISTLMAYKPDNLKVWKVRTLIASGNYDIDVLDDAAFRINEVPITKDSFTCEDGHVPGALEDMNLDNLLPSVTRYTVENIIGEPVIEPEDTGTYTYVRDYTGQRYYLGPKASSSQASVFRERIYETSIAYAQYISADGTLYDLRQNLYPNTTFWTNISSFDNQWFTTHDSLEFTNITIYDLLPLGDSAFVGTISFDSTTTSSEYTRTQENTYQLYFVKDTDDEWKCVTIITVSDNEAETAETETVSDDDESTEATATPTASAEATAETTAAETADPYEADKAYCAETWGTWNDAANACVWAVNETTDTSAETWTEETTTEERTDTSTEDGTG